MIKIASITYRKETGRSPYKWRFGIFKCYTEDYVSWLIGKWNESREDAYIGKVSQSDYNSLYGHVFGSVFTHRKIQMELIVNFIERRERRIFRTLKNEIKKSLPNKDEVYSEAIKYAKEIKYPNNTTRIKFRQAYKHGALLVLGSLSEILENKHKVEKLTKEQVEQNRSSAYSYMKLKK